MYNMTKLIYSVIYYIIMSGIRPTNVNRNLYVKFGNACRLNNQKISDVLENLMRLYIKHGPMVFKY